jgi:trehalose/maltose transport system substrate-binding protein
MWGGTTIIPGGPSGLIHLRRTLAIGKTGYTSIPGGRGDRSGALGGSGLAISRYSAHPEEAIELVRFLIRAEIQSSEQREVADQAAQPKFYDLPSISAHHNHSENSSQRGNGVVSRPSSVTGRKYEQVTRAYISAVHSVLTGLKDAPETAADLENELIKITGFSTGPPKTAE